MCTCICLLTWDFESNLVNYCGEMVENKYLIDVYSTVLDDSVPSHIFLPLVSYDMTCI